MVKVVILVGGRGLRLNELTQDIPKSMILINDKPLLLYILKHYAKYGFTDFIFCLGYKGEMIKEYFEKTDFNITFVDTGENSTKTERLKQVEHLIKEDIFLLSYGDDISNVDLNKLLEFHIKEKRMITLTRIQMKSDFGILQICNDYVTGFLEKPNLNFWMNGGYYVMNKEFFKHLEGVTEDFEKSVFPKIASAYQISAFEHNGFWKSVNHLKDVQELQNEIKLLEN